MRPLDRLRVDVAFMGTNGCSVEAGLTTPDPDTLCTLPRWKLQSATTEILNWVAAAGAMGSTPMELMTYQPGYRSPAGTGCGCAVGRWTPNGA